VNDLLKGSERRHLLGVFAKHRGCQPSSVNTAIGPENRFTEMLA
jgi:hypothetical protein